MLIHMELCTCHYTARYHKPCFMMRTQHTISEFHGYDAPASVVKMMNGVIAKVGTERRLKLVDPVF